MNDPWDVKSVLQAGQYVSCMKLNGVPLLPPVLSKECRKEMQYYKLLAKEVEKRISILQPYILESDSDAEDKTDAPELPESEQGYELPHEDIQARFNINTDKLTSISSSKNDEKFVAVSPRSPITDICNHFTTNVAVESIETSARSPSPQFIIDLSLSINETGKNVLETVKVTPHSPPQIDLPERDYNCTRRITQKVITEKEVITEVETHRNKKQKEMIHEVTDFHFSRNKTSLSDNYANITLSQDGPSSLSSKSFTGSLNDLHSESVKDLHMPPKMIRQRSYTLLKPSPQLLAHLEVQSINTGIDMSHISMSESYSNLSSPSKKRRSWDLESAKVKWSSMALELNQTNVVPSLSRNPSNKSFIKTPTKKPTHVSPPRTRSVALDKTRRNIVTPKPMLKSDPIPKAESMPRPEPILRSLPISRPEHIPRAEALSKPEALPKSEPITKPDYLSKTRTSISPIRNTSHRTFVKDVVTPKSIKKPEYPSQKHSPVLKSDPEDPATRVRELYEKIQNQQLLQMATLVEKQKREQILLQQVFEEQNTLLFKQLKTICPQSPIEVKEAWGEKHPEGDRGPVSLSQLINLKSPEQSSLSGPVSATLTDTNKYIHHCDSVLKKSRDITSGIKKPPVKSRSQNGAKIVSPRTQPEASRTRTNSPTQRNTPASAASRKLNYDTSASTDRDYEPILTDRTNDTMADLNVTFPSDNSDDCSPYNHRYNSSAANILPSKEIKTINGSVRSNAALHSKSTDNAIRNMERTIHNSINSTNARMSKPALNAKPTPEELAAATKIVAHARGYLVRRLMKTDRVQATVQTIKDALLCALQLHEDREGIRGADVDLHRRLIQQITAACYSLHDTFVASTASERCGMIAADRGRRRSLAARQGNNSFRQTDIMSQSHTGAFPAHASRPATTSQMTQSNYETFSGDKRWGTSVTSVSRPRRPWR